jgi:hypothetical protein
MATMFNRVRFRYTFTDIMRYFTKCICLRKMRLVAKDPALRKQLLFNKGS